MRLLCAIYEPFRRDAEWPIWQYVDLVLDADGLDASAVLASLPRIGERGATSLSYGLTWRGDPQLEPQPASRIVLTVAGLRHLPKARSTVDAFLAAIRYLVEEQRRLVPDPYMVVEASVSSEAIEEELLSVDNDWGWVKPLNRVMREVRLLIEHEPFLHGVVAHPQQGVEQWTARVPAILRAYRDVDSVDAYLDQLVEQVAPRDPPSVPPSAGPLDIPYAVGYLDAVWKSETGSHLFVNLDPASVARLTLACADEGDFNSLMSALADVLGSVVRPARDTPPQGGALEEIRDYLLPKLDAEVAGRVADAFRVLIQLRRIRVSTQHGDARAKAVAAFREIGLPFPPVSWDHAWTHIAALARGALDALREELPTVLTKPYRA